MGKNYPKIEFLIRNEEGIQNYSLGHIRCDGIVSEEQARGSYDKVMENAWKHIVRHSGLSGMIRHVEEGSVGVEIGAHYGDSSYWFLKNGIRHLHIVDPYVNQTDGDSWTGPQVDQELIDNRMRVMLKRLNGMSFTHHRVMSDDFFKFAFEVGLAADWVYVDGNHNYDYAYRDVVNSLRLIPVGGFVFVDDCHDYEWGVEVREAVTDAVTEVGGVDILHSSSDPAILRRVK